MGLGQGRGEIPSKGGRDSVHSALALLFFQECKRAAVLRVLSVGQVGRKRIWKAGPSWKVFLFGFVWFFLYIKPHGLAVSNLWTCSKVFVVSPDLFYR